MEYGKFEFEFESKFVSTRFAEIEKKSLPLKRLVI